MHGKAGEAFELQEKPLPRPVGKELLIKVEGFGLNYADVMARNGLYKDAPSIPFVPGYEVVGSVMDTGSEVPEGFIGKRVVAFTRFGGYADYVAADYRGTAVLEKNIPGGEACALATQYCTAFYMTDYISNLHEGETALIHAAAGGVGTALVQLCKRKKLSIIGLCSSADKVRYLEELGVDTPINYKEENYAEIIRKKRDGKGVDYIFNTVMGSSFKRDMGLLRHGGRLYCYGGSSRSGKRGHIFNDIGFLLQTGFVSPLFMMMKSRSVIGVNMLRIADNRIDIIGDCLSALLDLYANGEIHPKVGAEFLATDIATAHELLESGRSMGKIYVYW